MKNISNSLNEKDVENVYRSEFSKINESTITSPYGIDGLLSSKKIHTLLEFKYDIDLKNKLSQCIVLIQCLYYLKKFEDNGVKLPTTIFVGDMNECFIIHTNSIVKYLSSDVNWKIAPSEAHKKNPELLQEMVNDDNILPFVHDVDSNFNMSIVIDKIKDLSDNISRKIRLTKHNVVNIVDYFNKNGLKKNSLTTNEKANLFIQLIINPSENYLHPKRKNILVTKSFGDVNVDQNLIKSFFSHFEGDIYSPKEKEQLTALVDRLVEDTTRRSKGEFFTPTPFVNLAHNYISNTFGEDWKDRFVVWDCAWGTGNLTRDYKFKELYCSTLEQSDIDTANQMGYNMEATKFQFDFLNDDDSKLPQGLQDDIESGKEILFLINPPYATANVMGNNSESKEGISDTVVSKGMKSENYGACSTNLYAQFFYRIIKFQERNKNIKLCVFCKPNYLSGGSYEKFRTKFLSNFGYERGFLFQASHFSDVSTEWGINFALFGSKPNELKTDFVHDLVDHNDTFELQVKGDKNIYNLDKTVKASIWVRTDIKGLKTFDAPQISSATKIKQTGIGSLVTNSLGFFHSNANNVTSNNQSVSLLSGAFTKGHGLSIIKENYIKCNNLFTSRKLITSQYANWINDKDEYLAPNENHPRYEQFTYDSIVYSLFNNSSQQSSLRQVDYKDKKWDIKNEFFWMSKNDMLRLSEENNYDEIYKDAKTSNERFVYNKLFGEERIYDKLSETAKEVLDMATELTVNSFKMRKLVSENNPEYHLDSWDAGYAQLKLVWKDYFKDEFNLFRSKYKELEDSLRPLVYELGFLRS